MFATELADDDGRKCGSRKRGIAGAGYLDHVTRLIRSVVPSPRDMVVVVEVKWMAGCWETWWMSRQTVVVRLEVSATVFELSRGRNREPPAWDHVTMSSPQL